MKNDEIIEKIKNRAIDESFAELILERIIPLTNPLYVEALYYLMQDERFKEQAENKINSLPNEFVEEYFAEKKADPLVLKYLFDSRKSFLSEKALLYLVRNLSTPESVLVEIAKIDNSTVLSELAENEMKLLAFQTVLKTLSQNESLSPEKRFKLVETIKRIEAEDEKVKEEVAKEKEKEEIEEEKIEVSFEGYTEEKEVKHLSHIEIRNLPVGERIKLALFGPKEVRQILLTDPSRVVREAAIESPKISEKEVETIAKQKNMYEDVIQKIAKKKEWISKYPILLGLIKNPKTPLAFSLKNIVRLHPRDLKEILKSKDVPEPLRKRAKALLVEKKMI